MTLFACYTLIWLLGVLCIYGLVVPKLGEIVQIVYIADINIGQIFTNTISMGGGGHSYWPIYIMHLSIRHTFKFCITVCHQMPLFSQLYTQWPLIFLFWTFFFWYNYQITAELLFFLFNVLKLPDFVQYHT